MNGTTYCPTCEYSENLGPLLPKTCYRCRLRARGRKQWATIDLNDNRAGMAAEVHDAEPPRRTRKRKHPLVLGRREKEARFEEELEETRHESITPMTLVSLT